jgi:hypothetical protein
MRTEFSLGKNFAKSSCLSIAEKFYEIFFRQCGEGHHILYAIFNTGQKISVINFSPMRAGGEIGENFLLAKITYMVLHLPHPLIHLLFDSMFSLTNR